MRYFSLIVLLVLAFQASANNGLEALGNAYVKLLILFIWLIASLASLFIFIQRFFTRKKIKYRYLVYSCFASLTILYYLVFSTFYRLEGSLIFDNTVNNAYKTEAKSQFSILIFLGCVLALGIVLFIIADRKMTRGNKEST